MAMFKAFKPSGMEKIARSMGYQGNMQGFQNFLAQDPMRQQQMTNYTNKAMQMAKGGVVKKYAPGGLLPGMQPSVPPAYGPPGTYSLTGQAAPTGTQGTGTQAQTTQAVPTIAATGVVGQQGTPIATLRQAGLIVITFRCRCESQCKALLEAYTLH